MVRGLGGGRAEVSGDSERAMREVADTDAVLVEVNDLQQPDFENKPLCRVADNLEDGLLKPGNRTPHTPLRPDVLLLG